MSFNILKSLFSGLINHKRPNNDPLVAINTMADDELKAFRKNIWEQWRFQANGPARENNWHLMKDVIDVELAKREEAKFYAKYPDGKVPGHEPWTDKNRWEKIE